LHLDSLPAASSATCSSPSAARLSHHFIVFPLLPSKRGPSRRSSVSKQESHVPLYGRHCGGRGGNGFSLCHGAPLFANKRRQKDRNCCDSYTRENIARLMLRNETRRRRRAPIGVVGNKTALLFAKVEPARFKSTSGCLWNWRNETTRGGRHGNK